MKLIRFKHNGEIFNGSILEDGISIKSDSPIDLKLDEVELVAPVAPSKIVSVGLNYRDHAKELDMPVPSEPVIFIKPNTALIGPGEDIIYPASSTRVDYEAELGVVIKDRTRNVTQEEAKSHVLGFTCANDVTARDLQKKDGQWTRAKSFDTFAPIGPWIETDINPDNLKIRSYLNGEIKQSSSTSEFIFSVWYLVSFISSVMTLLPGDVILTGTPAGIGRMKPGDKVIVEIEGIGRLENQVK